MTESVQAARDQSRVALVTCLLFPNLWDDDLPLLEALRQRQVTVDVVRWDDPTVDWAAFDLVVIRSPWDYVARRDEFVAWARQVPRLLNPADIVEWNTDKRYLRDLAAAGLPIIPTGYVSPGEVWAPPTSGEWVVKPTISAGSQDTGRYLLPEQHELAVAHVARLTAAGRTAMVQPYLSAVATAGETAVLCLPDAGGELTFSHAARKGPMLTETGGGPVDLTSEDITAREPTAAELAVARRVLEAVPGGSKRLLYARIDMIPGPDGTPLLVELELTEPSLFLRTAPEPAGRLADGILARL